MPFILPPIDGCNATFEQFRAIVEKYKQVIEKDDTARCMIGFTAASMIRNKEGTDLKSFENWLQSIEQRHNTNQDSFDENIDTKVIKILHVVETASMHYYVEEETSDEELNDCEEHNIQEFVTDRGSAHALDRYTSRGPYASNQSYPRYTYTPDRTFVNRTFENGPGNLCLPLEETSSTLSY